MPVYLFIIIIIILHARLAGPTWNVAWFNIKIIYNIVFNFGDLALSSFKFIETASIASIENSQYGNWANWFVFNGHPTILHLKKYIKVNCQSQQLSQSLSWDLLQQTKEKWCLKKNRVSMPQRGFSMYLTNHQNLVTWKIHVHMGTKPYNVISTERFSILTVWSTTHTADFEVLRLYVLSFWGFINHVQVWSRCLLFGKQCTSFIKCL